MKTQYALKKMNGGYYHSTSGGQRIFVADLGTATLFEDLDDIELFLEGEVEYELVTVVSGGR